MFGDGAARQGALHEAFNMAMIWKIPVLYIVENNGYAMGTSVERTSNVEDMSKIGLSYDMPSESVDGMDPAAVHDAVLRAAEHIRKGLGPYFFRDSHLSLLKVILFLTLLSTEQRMKSKSYQDRDPIKMTEKHILLKKIATAEEIAVIKKAVKEEN